MEPQCKWHTIGIVVTASAAAAVVLYALVQWMSWHDRAVQTAALLYEACVRTEYGMSPLRWYSEQGEYPECHSTYDSAEDTLTFTQSSSTTPVWSF